MNYQDVMVLNSLLLEGTIFFKFMLFKKNDDVNSLDILSEISLMASKSNLSDFWMKESMHSYDNKDFRRIYVFKAIDIEGNNVKFC